MANTNIEMTDYQAVSQNANDGDEKPPSYFNIFPELKAIKDSEENPMAKIQLFGTILAGSCNFLIFLYLSDSFKFENYLYFIGLTTICLTIFSIIPIASIVVGVRSLDKCVIQRSLPSWLIVYGSASLGTILINNLTGERLNI